MHIVPTSALLGAYVTGAVIGLICGGILAFVVADWLSNRAAQDQDPAVDPEPATRPLAVVVELPRRTGTWSL